MELALSLHGVRDKNQTGKNRSMKDIRIKINQFGPLRDVELKMSPLTILTGESSLGKSYANYLFYYFISSFSIYNTKDYDAILPCLRYDGEKKKSLRITRSDIEDWLNKGATPFMQQFLGCMSIVCDVEFELSWLPEVISYQYEIYSITDKLKNLDPNVKYADNMSYAFNGKHKRDMSATPTKLMPCLAFQQSMKEDFAGYEYLFPKILPPGRCTLIGQNFSLTQAVVSSMGMYDDFIRQMESATRRSLAPNKHDEIEQIISGILGGTLTTRSGEAYLELKGGENLELRAAASSIKEISPLIYHYLNMSGQHFSFCFDEPEAHLHPQMQSRVADFVAAYFNKGSLFQITTHSDYFLSRINQLIKLGEIRKKDETRAETLCQELKIPSSAILDKNDVGAYYFERKDDGGVSVRQLEVTGFGIPFATFYDTISTDRDNDDEISTAYYELNCDEE